MSDQFPLASLGPVVISTSQTSGVALVAGDTDLTVNASITAPGFAIDLSDGGTVDIVSDVMADTVGIFEAMNSASPSRPRTISAAAAPGPSRSASPT